MMHGAEQFKALFEKFSGRPIMLYGDPDPDGLFSLYLMVKFCEMLGKPYTYYVNEHRYHGFTLKPESLNGYLVIAADFHITEGEMQSLVDNNVVILSTDHHEIFGEFVDVVNSTYGTEGIILNNQYYFEPEEDKYLSGAGVFYELICSLWPQFKSEELEAIVGITLLTDIRAIENPKARAYLTTTYNIRTNSDRYPYVKYLIEQTIDKKQDNLNGATPKLDRNYIDYTLGPKLNALLRLNDMKATYDFIFGKGLANFGIEYKERQSTLVDVMVARAQTMKLSNITFAAFVKDRDFTDVPDADKLSDFVGIVCNKLRDKDGGQNILGFTIDHNKVTRASFRARYDDIPYLSSIRQLLPNADGHQGAFGIKDFEPTQDIWNKLNDLISDLESMHQSSVNIIPVKNLASFINVKGTEIATENAYVRDSYRTYIKYEGAGAIKSKETYKLRELTYEDKLHGRTADVTQNGKEYVYLLDTNGQRIPKYIEYYVDDRLVKSLYGDKIEDCVIMPIMERGLIRLYIKPMPR